MFCMWLIIIKYLFNLKQIVMCKTVNIDFRLNYVCLVVDVPINSSKDLGKHWSDCWSSWYGAGQFHQGLYPFCFHNLTYTCCMDLRSSQYSTTNATKIVVCSILFVGWHICKYDLIFVRGARCSSVVRAFAYGAMGCWIDPSWWKHWAISYSSQCSMTGVTNAMVCIILSVGWCI